MEVPSRQGRTSLAVNQAVSGDPAPIFWHRGFGDNTVLLLIDALSIAVLCVAATAAAASQTTAKRERGKPRVVEHSILLSYWTSDWQTRIAHRT